VAISRRSVARVRDFVDLSKTPLDAGKSRGGALRIRIEALNEDVSLRV
jgi:hypothetical protein